MTPTETYHSPKSTKKDLKKALAETLGIEYSETNANEKIETDYKICVAFFMKRYKEITKLDYNFNSRDGKSIKDILTKIEHITKTGNISETFKYLIQNLPDWYKQNAFSLIVINSKFNEIIASIKASKNKVSDEYKQQIIRDIFQ
ncbi:hypothetical protein DK150_550057 [Flavobacterium psychrophilum]|uniref:hypothetical protein n=1 Tax=Flavobacterium psychrophilum TaxID=96345 RepID=UPI000B7C3EE4|nr:hypothetical protein [Flavobacterium psychrophilum]SNA83282.1 hypothetical protein DK150_550057 [Flavobacterium psychrophilum]